jgi:MFS family permease
LTKIKDSSKYGVLAILFYGWIVDYMDRMVMGVSLPFIGKTFNLDAASLGIVLSSFFAGYAIMQIPSGWLTDKFGSRKMLLISIVVWSICTILTGLAWSLTSLLIIRVLFGIGEGSYPAASTKAIAEHFLKKDTGKSVSTMLSSNPLGAAVAPLFAAPLIALLGWRHMFILISIFGIILIILIAVYVYRPKRYSTTKKESTNKKNRVNNISIIDLMKSKLMWKLVVTWFGLSITIWGFVTWLPSYLINVKGLPLVNAGIMASLPFFAGFIAMNLCGWLIDKFFVNKEKYVALTVSVIGAICLYLMFSVNTIRLVILFEILAGFFLEFGFAAIWSLPLKLLPTEVIGSATGIINFGGQVAGFIAPMVMGFLITASGGSYVTAFWFLISGAILSAIVSSMLTRDKKLENKIKGYVSSRAY